MSPTDRHEKWYITKIKQIFDHIAITPLGIFSFLIGAWVYVRFGSEEQDFVLFMSGFAIVICTTIFIVLAYLERWRLKRELSRIDEIIAVKVEVDQDFLTGFSLPSIPLNPLFQTTVSWHKPTAREYHLELFNGRLNELIKPRRRGKVVEVQRVFIMEDLFGFTSLRWIERQKCDINVYPQSTPSHELRLSRPQQGEDFYDPIGEAHGDLIEMRRYEDGDPLKWVMWRIYARNRQLVVRSPERALSEKRDLVAYFVAHSSDESSASTARSYLEAGLLGEQYIFIADGCVGQARNKAQVMDHLLSSAEGETLSALPELLSLPAQQQRGVIVFASALTPPDQLLTVVTALPSPPLVILSISLNSSQAMAPEQPWWHKLLKSTDQTESNSRTLGHLSAVKELVNHLSSYQKPLVIAQPSGRQLDTTIIS